MIETVTEKLDKVLEEELKAIESETDPEEKRKRMNAVSALYKERVQYESVRSTEDAAFKKANTDIVIAETQAANDKKNRIWNGVIKGAEIGIPLIFEGVWLGRVMRFEETGKACSDCFRHLWGRLGRR